ncbi:MAG: hypothetical protein RPU64_13565 [Candidatus Sedimenticola sp. (ex Thyasira tokunagai)]
MNPFRLFTLLLLLLLYGCSQEQQNRISRIGVSWLEGNYRVTFASGNHVKEWEVRDGKVTSDPQKGYYYFWAKVDGRKVYVQTPVERSYVEEL